MEECETKAADLLGKTQNRPMGIKELIFMTQCQGCGTKGMAHYYEAYASRVTVGASPAAPDEKAENTLNPPGSGQSGNPASAAGGSTEAETPDDESDPVAQPVGEEKAISQIPEKNREEEINEILAGATPGIQNAMNRYLSQRKAQREPSPDRDEKPGGYTLQDGTFSDWVAAGSEEENSGSSLIENTTGALNAIRDYLDMAATTSQVLGYETHEEIFQKATDYTQPLETAGRLWDAFAGVTDDESRRKLFEDVMGYPYRYGGTAGVSAGQFSPPIEVYQNTFEGAFRRMDQLLTTGDAGDEIQATAPLLNWFGNTMGMGDIGTRERNYRLEGSQSFGELKDQYGWVEATKQKLYNWIRE